MTQLAVDNGPDSMQDTWATYWTYYPPTPCVQGFMIRRTSWTRSPRDPGTHHNRTPKKWWSSTHMKSTLPRKARAGAHPHPHNEKSRAQTQVRTHTHTIGSQEHKLRCAPTPTYQTIQRQMHMKSTLPRKPRGRCTSKPTYQQTEGERIWKPHQRQTIKHTHKSTLPRRVRAGVHSHPHIKKSRTQTHREIESRCEPAKTHQGVKNTWFL